NWQRGETGFVQLWELASGQERGRTASEETSVEALAFSPDGRLLTPGSYDSTALVWDGTGLCPDGRWPPRDAAAADPERQVAALVGGEGARAYRAMWARAASPRSVPFLAKRVRPVAPPEKGRLARLLADLESEQFAVRDRASQELAAAAELAEPA